MTTDPRDARRHIADWCEHCSECSGLRTCDMHREAYRTLSREGADAYQEFVRENAGRDHELALAEMADDIAQSFGADMADELADNPWSSFFEGDEE